MFKKNHFLHPFRGINMYLTKVMDDLYIVLKSSDSLQKANDLINTAGRFNNVIAIEALSRLLAIVYTEKEFVEKQLPIIHDKED
jgi:hypothetical protein